VQTKKAVANPKYSNHRQNIIKGMNKKGRMVKKNDFFMVQKLIL
jgi:hypothetical protein